MKQTDDLRQLPPRPRRSAVAVRAGRTGLVFARHGAQLAKRVLSENRGAATASELRLAFEALGPTYVKLAQLLSLIHI